MQLVSFGKSIRYIDKISHHLGQFLKVGMFCLVTHCPVTYNGTIPIVYYAYENPHNLLVVTLTSG